MYRISCYVLSFVCCSGKQDIRVATSCGAE